MPERCDTRSSEIPDCRFSLDPSPSGISVSRRCFPRTFGAFPARPARSSVAIARVCTTHRIADGRARGAFEPDWNTMNKGLVWTIVGILLIIALIIWIMQRV
jgi:hypothetical protein